MAIELEWQNESGKTLARYDGPKIDQKVWSWFPASGACLRFVDPAGDAVFNQAQIKVLAAELDALIYGTKRAPPSALVAMRQFLDQAIGKTHTYVKFLGD